jgi:hypothetical protein
MISRLAPSATQDEQISMSARTGNMLNMSRCLVAHTPAYPKLFSVIRTPEKRASFRSLTGGLTNMPRAGKPRDPAICAL